MYGAVILLTIFIEGFCDSSERTNPFSLAKTMANVNFSIMVQQLNSKLQINGLYLHEQQRTNKILNKSVQELVIKKINTISKSYKRDVDKAKVCKRSIKSNTNITLNIKKITKNHKLIKPETDVSLSYEQILQSSKKIKKSSRKKSKFDLASNYDSSSGKESADFDSNEIKVQLKEGEELLDFSVLAKMKSFSISNDSDHSSHSERYLGSKENPFLNLNCTSFSLEEEQNMSTGYIDERIARVIEKADDYPDGGTQLLEDIHKYYCYLKHVNTLVVNKVKRGKALMKKLVEEDPAFTQIRFDTDELTEHFSWVGEEKEAFEHLMDALCYQWKCLVARHSH